MSKQRQKNRLKDPGLVFERGGWTNRDPEMRRGTRTFAAFMLQLPEPQAIRLASPRQQNKARRLVDQGVHWKNAPGRIIRALMRSYWADIGREADGKYYGHP